MAELLTVGLGRALLAGLIAIAGLAALALRIRAVRGTTLVAPSAWSIVSLLSVCLAETAGTWPGDSATGSSFVELRFAAAMSTFCPMTALLGARRPQDRGWQWIVLSLWAILSLPSIEWLLFGGTQEIHAARFWFLGILTSVGALNGVATRFWPASVLFCLGQAMLLSPYLPAISSALPTATGPLWGIGLLVTAWVLPAIGWPRSSTAGSRLDRVWLDFRDAYGAVWGLRIVERMNAAASVPGWPARLGWRGFRLRQTGTPIAPWPEGVEDALRTLLRRFVSEDWLAARLGPSVGSSHESKPSSKDAVA